MIAADAQVGRVQARNHAGLVLVRRCARRGRTRDVGQQPYPAHRPAVFAGRILHATRPAEPHWYSAPPGPVGAAAGTAVAAVLALLLLVPVLLTGCKGPAIAPSVALTESLRLPQPTGVTAQDVPDDAGGKVAVAWHKSAADDDSGERVAGYVVWRSPPGPGQYKAASGLLPPGAEQAVVSVPENDVSYEFAVSAIAPAEAKIFQQAEYLEEGGAPAPLLVAGAEAVLAHAEAEARDNPSRRLAVKLRRSAELPQPTGLAAEDAPNDQGKQIKLTWQKSAGDDGTGEAVAGYVLWRAEQREGPYEAHTLMLGPGVQEITDKVPENKRPYHYKVSALAPSEDQVFVTGAYLSNEKILPPELPAELAAKLPTASAAASGQWFNTDRINVLTVSLLFSVIVLVCLTLVRRGRELYVRPIAGLEAVDDAIGRATEMGRPILYVSGLTGVSDISTIASMIILGRIARRTAEYETPLLVPCNDALVMAAEREIVREAYLDAGKMEAYNPDNVFYVTDSQFGYVAAVSGLMMRERPATNFYMGYFYAESLILAETGAAAGSIQIAGTDADTQLPFFITACDYTLMGEELYAASAYLSREPVLLGTLKGQDIGKLAIGLVIVIGVLAATFGWTAFVTWFSAL